MRLLLALSLLFANQVWGADGSCETEAKKIFSGDVERDTKSAVKKWAEREDSCKNHPDYYIHLGTLQVTSGALVEGERSYLKGIELHPQNEYGYTQLAGLRLAQDDYKDVLRQCNVSLNLKPNYTCYRHAAIAFVFLKRPERAIELFSLAYEQNTQALADVDLMTSVAMAYADTKKWDLARNSLAVLMRDNPPAEKSENFAIAVEYIKKAMAAHGVTSIK